MFRSLMTRTVVVALAFAGVLSIAGDASATYQIRISGPTILTGTVSDLPAGPAAGGGLAGIATDGQSAPLTGVDIIDFVGTGGGPFVLSLGSGSSLRTLTFTTLNTTASAPSPNSLSYNYSIVYDAKVSGLSQALKIEISRDNYNFPPAGLSVYTASAGGTFNAGSTGTMQVRQDYDNGNGLYANPGTLQFNTGVHSSSDPFQTWSNNFSAITNSSTPYSFTSIIDLNFTNSNGSFSGNGTMSLTSAIPVPAGLVLALTGLPALGFFSRLRRRNTVQA